MWQLSPPTLHRHKHILRVICWATPPATPLLWCGLPLLALPLDQLLPPSLTSCHFGLSSCVAAWAAVTPLVIHSLSLSLSLSISFALFLHFLCVSLQKLYYRTTSKNCKTLLSFQIYVTFVSNSSHTHSRTLMHTHTCIYTHCGTHMDTNTS